MCLSIYAPCVCSAPEGQNGESDPLKLELGIVVSCHLGIKPRFSGRAARTLTHWVISPDLATLLQLRFRVVWLFFLFCFVFETGIHCVALDSLEFTISCHYILWGRVTGHWSFQICMQERLDIAFNEDFTNRAISPPPGPFPLHFLSQVLGLELYKTQVTSYN